MANSTSLFFNDELLPGVITEIQQDNTYNYYVTEWGTTSSVIVIGTAFSGPVNKVTKIYSPEHAMYVYGGTYDNKTHKEATLVTGVQDAYDRGCRAIYACRIAGQEVYKDFELIPDTNYKLRVTGLYPSNDNKNIYLYFDKTPGDMKIRYYKPANKATIDEKMNGVIESSDSMIQNVFDFNSMNISEESQLTDLITKFNTTSKNNVLKLSIVDNNGADVTSNPEVLWIPVNALFDGVYFIGRDTSTCNTFTNVDHKVSAEDSFWNAYSEISTYKTLSLNSDVSKAYPISGSYDILRKIFTNIITTSKFDFISDINNVNALYIKDANDYEQVDINGFDLYKALGSGYAITAKLELKNPDIKNPTMKDYIVKEVPSGDDNRIQALTDGLYSMLQNVPSDYRVLAHGVASDSVEGKLPKKTDFIKQVPGVVGIPSTINNTPTLLTATYKPSDYADRSDTISFEIAKVAEDDILTYADIKDKYYTTSIKRIRTLAASTLETSTAIMHDGDIFVTYTDATYNKLYIVINGVAKEFDESCAIYKDTMFVARNDIISVSVSGSTITPTIIAPEAFNSKTSKDYFLIDTDGIISVAEYKDSDGNTIIVYGSIEDILSEDNAGLYAYQSTYDYGVNTYLIKYTDSYKTSTTLDGFIDDLNNSTLGKSFTFEIGTNFYSYKNEYLDSEELGFADAVINESTPYLANVFDTNTYIPYRTTDNFARQLAQHCTYTSLKTHATHGILGYRRIGDSSTMTIAKLVTEACNTSFDLYAKKANGNNMLGKNNDPYDIGRNISITFGGYYVSTPDNYTFVSTGASGYAGMISSLPYDQSSTNQPIDLNVLLVTLTNYQLEQLTNAGYVTFKDSYTKGIVVTDGITMAPNSSVYKRLSTTRIIGAVETLIRTAAEPFIGQPNSFANRNSLQTAIKSALQKIIGTLINDYEFTLQSDNSQQKLGIITIDYAIIPFYEIRQVRNTIRITDSI